MHKRRRMRIKRIKQRIKDKAKRKNNPRTPGGSGPTGGAAAAS